jgi:glycerol-3-phosphate dehydrogenase
LIPSTPYLWAELRHAARAEGVIHLDDLLLRRVRLGLLAPNGGMDLLPRIRAIVQPELGWGDLRWEKEVGEYADLWKRAYALS